MEFNQKLQELRKQKGLTQEELAQALYVSRTAVSKWEQGRGYPGIDSLKAIAAFFSVTIDDLLSGGEVLTIAEEDNRKTQACLLALVFSLLDCSCAALLFLPFFGQNTAGTVHAVSLFSLTAPAFYLRGLYWIAIIGMSLIGLVNLIVQTLCKAVPLHGYHKLSLVWNAAAAFLFIISRQSYAAAFLFVFLAIKVFMLIKRQ